MTTRRRVGKKFVVCVSNAGYAASLEPRKLYQVLPDAEAKREGLLRVIDESGEDYLFPSANFAAVSLRPEVQRRLASG
jgi:hypothetical protein